VLTFAMGLALTVAIWGWSDFHSIFRVVRIESSREGKMLSIFCFLSQSRFSPVARTSFAQVLVDWNIVTG